MRRLLLAAVLALPLIAVAPLIVMAQDAPPTPPTPPAPGAPPDATIGRPAMTPEMRQAVQTMRAACAADAARLCPDAVAAAQSPAEGQGGGQRGRGGAMRCMMQHAADVSPPCAQAIGAVRALRHADHG